MAFAEAHVEPSEFVQAVDLVQLGKCLHDSVRALGSYQERS